VLKKPRDGGDITMLYMGVTFTDTDIYVPEKLLERAKSIIENEPADQPENDTEFNEHKQEHDEILKKKQCSFDGSSTFFWNTSTSCAFNAFALRNKLIFLCRERKPCREN
jgi:hypothetical protein